MVVRLAADENFRRPIVEGLLRRRPDLDVVFVQTAGPAGEHDPVVLDWAAREARVMLTHDRKTVPRYAYERIARGQPMSGVVVVDSRYPVGRAIEDILLLLECTFDEEWRDQVFFVPF